MAARSARLLSADEGRLVAVVGPSGVGKDSVLAASQQSLSHRSDIHFVQRVITRDGNAGGEAHASVTDSEFMELQKKGAFSVTWQAHGLHYGVPVSVTDKIRHGFVVILNGSRGALPAIQQAYPQLHVVHLVVDHAILAQRLGARARESDDQIQQRLARQCPVTIRESRDIVIRNNGELSEAVASFVAFVEGLDPLS